MNKEKFIESIIQAVRDGAISDSIENLKDPLGRHPAPQDLLNSQWFHSLNSDEKNRLKAIVSESIDSAIFGFLCVLDGVRAIEEPGQKGTLTLGYQKSGKQFILNDIHDEYLHDIYKSKIQSE